MYGKFYFTFIFSFDIYNQLPLVSIRKFFSNIGLMLLLNLLVKPIYMLMETAVQNNVGHEAYGDYSAALSFAFILVWLADWGVNQHTTQSIAQDASTLKPKMPYLLSLKLSLTFLFPLLVGVFSYLYYQSTWGASANESQWNMIYLAFLGGVIMSATKLMEFYRSIFQALQAFKIDSFASVLERFLLIAGVGILLYFGINIYSFVYLRIFCLVLCCLIFAVGLRKISDTHLPKWNWQEKKQILKASFPFAMIMFLYSANDKIDQLLLKELKGSAETGLYAAAYRFLDASSNYLWIILPLFFARFAYFHANKVEKERLLYAGQIVTALPLMFLSLFVHFYGGKFLFLFKGSTGEEIMVILSCLKVLFYSSFVGGMFAIFSTLLTSTGHERFVNKIIIAGIIINVVSNLIFVPQYGCIAAAWNTLINNLFLCLCEIIYLQFKTDIRVPYWQSFKLLLLAFFAYITFFLLYDTSHWLIVSGIVGLSYLLVAFLLKLLPSPKALMEIFKKPAQE
ncbi:MAG: oligosaccharide flippase family protein [Bacteroidia bacterium]